MSIKASAWAWAQKNLTPTEKYVLICLADFYNEGEKRAWPRQITLQDMTLLSLSTIKRAISGLAKKNYIKIYSTKEHGRQKANRYALNLGLIFISGPGVTMTPSQGSPRHPVGGHSEPLVEPLIELLKEPLNGETFGHAEKDMKEFGQQDVEEALKGSLTDVKIDPTQAISEMKKSGSRYTVASLRKVWASLYSYHGYGFLPEWTMKEKGQINQIQKKLDGSSSSASGISVLGVLEIVLSKWHQFTAATTMYKPPKKPNVGFLLKNVGTAGDMYLQTLLQPIAIKAEGVFDDTPYLTKTTGMDKNKTNDNLLDDLDKYET